MQEPNNPPTGTASRPGSKSPRLSEEEVVEGRQYLEQFELADDRSGFLENLNSFETRVLAAAWRERHGQDFTPAATAPFAAARTVTGTAEPAVTNNGKPVRKWKGNGDTTEQPPAPRPLSRGARWQLKRRRAVLCALAREAGMSQPEYIAKLSKELGRDVRIPREVSAAELGQHIGMTLERLFALEARERVFRLERFRPNDDGPNEKRNKRKPHLVTVLPIGVTPQGLKRARRQHLNAQRREAKMKHAAAQAAYLAAYAEAKAATAANGQDQRETLLDAIAPQGSTVAMLMAKVSDDPSWQALAGGNQVSFRRVVKRRLDRLEDDGLIISILVSGKTCPIRLVRRVQTDPKIE